MDLALLPGDGGVGGGQALLGRQDAGIGLGQLGLEGDGIQGHHHLIRLDQIAFVDEDLQDPQRLLGGHVDQLGLETAVAGGEALRQGALLRLPELVTEEGDDNDGDDDEDELQGFLGHFCHG